MRFKETLQKVMSVGLKNVVQAIRYAGYRDRQDHNYVRSTGQAPISPTDIVSTARLTNGERFRFVCGPGRIELEIIFLAPDLVRLSWGNANQPIPYAIEKIDWPPVILEHTVSAGEYRIESTALIVKVLPDGGIRFVDISGITLREETPPEFQDNKSIHRALLEPDASIYGLGERAAPLNLRGGSYVMWNSDTGGSYGPGRDPLYTCIPVYMVVSPNNSYLVFFENSSRARFSFSETAEAVFESGMLRYYFITGSPAGLLERYTELTGKPNFPPLWALGYHQSRWGYKTETDVRKVIQGFKQHQMHISAIHLDIDYMRGFRVFTIDTDRFPNLKRLSDELETQNVKIVTILDPGVKEDQNYFMYREGIEQEFFCTDSQGNPLIGVVWPGRALFPDFTNPAVRHWWSGKNQILLDAGVAGIWHDMNEPSSFSAWGDLSLPVSARHNFEGQGGDHLQGHNLYGFLMARAGYEALQQYYPEKRPWILTRAGWAGYQRYAWNWTGDIETSWHIMKRTIATVLGLSLTGQPYSGPDIGGFSGDPSPELYTRWFQLSSFLPFFRTHSSITSQPREPWSFGEPYTTITRYFLKLRYRLLPYWYSLAWQAHQVGTPLIRPLFWLDPSNPKLHQADDAFLLGDSLLIAPILEEGATTRKLNLPPGLWFDYWDDTPHQTTDTISISAPLDRMPLFVQAGTMLPLQEENTLTLHIYLPGTTPHLQKPALTLYTDAGDGYPVHPKDFRIDRFFILLENGTILIRRETTGDYPWPYPVTRLQFHGSSPSQAIVDGILMPIQNMSLETGLFNEVVLNLP